MNSTRMAMLAGLFLSTAAIADEKEREPEAAAPVDETKQIRVRWGLNGALGYTFPAGAVDFGASGRVGAQLSNMLGVYADIGHVAGIGLGGSVTGTGAAISVSGVGFWHIAAMAELDLGKFFLAGGPMIANGGWGQVSQKADSSGNVSQYVVAAGGLMPGLDLRTGFTFGDRRSSGRLSGFTIGIDFQMLNAGVTSVNQTAGTTGASQAIRTGDRVWGFTPLLMFGYDAR